MNQRGRSGGNGPLSAGMRDAPPSIEPHLLYRRIGRDRSSRLATHPVIEWHPGRGQPRLSGRLVAIAKSYEHWFRVQQHSPGFLYAALHFLFQS